MALALCSCGNPNTMRPVSPDGALADAASEAGADVADAITVDASDAATPDAPPMLDAAVDGADVALEGATSDAGGPGVVRLSSGSFAHSCAVLRSGQVRCWGVNDNGQLGVPPVESRQQCRVPQSSPARNLPCETAPRDVPGLSDVVDVSAGNGGTCAVQRDGAVWCWGTNDVGELGQGNNDTQPHGAPVRVTLAPAQQVTYGAFHVCALLRDGTVSCWGNNKFGQCGTAPAMSDSQCDPGDGIRAGCMLRPRAVQGLRDVRRVSAGRNHTCAVLMDGTVQCWGLNDSAQLGNGMVEPDSRPRAQPVAVSGLTKVVEVASGGSHTCARRMAGWVHCWGWADLGQLGGAPTTQCEVGSAPPFRCARSAVAVPELSGATSLAAGRWHTCATTGTTIRCAGRDDEGQLGRGMISVTRCSAFPDQFACGRSFEEITAPAALEVTVGNYHSCARMVSGEVRCWGGGYYGQVGDGMVTNRNTPVATNNLP